VSAARAAVLPFGLIAAAAVLWFLTLAPITPADMTDLGLISALPIWYWVAIAALGLAFGIGLSVEPFRPSVAIAAAIVLALVLYGTPAIAQALPRFNTTYVHLGFIDLIERTGRLYPEMDARFSWPLFFVATALVSAATTVDLLAIAAWVPLATNLLALPALVLLYRAFTDDQRLVWLGAWVFLLANWVGQDYLSPQGFNLLLLLWMLALVATYFQRRGRPRWLRPGRGPDDDDDDGQAWPGEPASVPYATRAGIYVVVVALALASVASHQLTPFAMMAASFGLVIVDRTTLRALPILIGVLLVIWVSFVAEAFITGHLRDLVAELGTEGGTAGELVSRVRGSPGHTFVVIERIAFSVAIWAAAAIGVVRRVRSGRWDLAAIALAVIPIVLAVQPYGGEAPLRVFLFSLPATSYLVATAVFPVPRRLGIVGVAGMTGLTVVMAAGLTIARYGNELADMVTPSELAVVDEVHRIAPEGAFLATMNFNSPIRYQFVERYDYEEIAAPMTTMTAATLAAILDVEGAGRPTYVVLTRGQRAHDELIGVPPTEWPRIEAELEASPWFEPVVREADGSAYRYTRAEVAP
jgi:hypothetical protein